jgi:hypothetical protein
MKKNYKIQNTNKVAHELHELTRIPGVDYTGKITTKGSHGLHQDSFKLQTMTALIKSFCRGSRGTVFSKRVPLAGKKRNKVE